jgi:hypothetical protein
MLLKKSEIFAPSFERSFVFISMAWPHWPVQIPISEAKMICISTKSFREFIAHQSYAKYGPQYHEFVPAMVIYLLMASHIRSLMETSDAGEPALQGVVLWVEEMMDLLMKPEEITDYFKTMVGSMIRFILEPEDYIKLDQANGEIKGSRYFKTAAYYKHR